MKTKEAVLQRFLGEHAEDPIYQMDELQKSAAYEAMDEYAKQQAIAFAEWLRDNTIADGAPRLLLKSTPTHHSKRMNITDLYAQFIEHQNKNIK